MTTALILKNKPTRTLIRILSFYRFIMILAIAHLSQLKILLALAALENVEIRPDLPIYLLPRYPIALPHMSNEFLKVPLPVNHVFCPLLSMSINKYFPFRTAEKRPLLFSEKFQTISALVEIVSLFFEQMLQFLHKQPAYQFVFSFLQGI